jgi:hypothetical protein
MRLAFTPMSSILDKLSERSEGARTRTMHEALGDLHNAQLSTGAAQIIFVVLDLHYSLSLAWGNRGICQASRREFTPHTFALELNANVYLCLTRRQ